MLKFALLEQVLRILLATPAKTLPDLRITEDKKWISIYDIIAKTQSNPSRDFREWLDHYPKYKKSFRKKKFPDEGTQKSYGVYRDDLSEFLVVCEYFTKYENQLNTKPRKQLPMFSEEPPLPPLPEPPDMPEAPEDTPTTKTLQTELELVPYALHIDKLATFGWSQQGKHLIPNVIEGYVVREMENLKKEGKAPSEIARHLNDRGLRTRLGATWNEDQIHETIERNAFLWERCFERMQSTRKPKHGAP